MAFHAPRCAHRISGVWHSVSRVPPRLPLAFGSWQADWAGSRKGEQASLARGEKARDMTIPPGIQAK
eukprot:4369452-Lingulodinium_polyedra.AAC.1